MVALNQMSPRNRDGKGHSGFSPRKRGAKPKGERGGRRGKDWPLLPIRDWEERTTAAHPCPPPIRLPELVPLCPGEGSECAKAPKCQKKGGKAAQFLNFPGWGAESLTRRRGCVPASRQGAGPQSQSWLCPTRWSLTHSFISSFHSLFIYFVFTLSSLGAPP